MYSLRTTARPFTPSDCRHLPEDARPVFWLRPQSSGAVHDARSAARVEDEEPVDQSAFCSECGAKISVKVRMRLPGQIDGGAFVHESIARAIDRVDDFGFDGEAAPWPADVGAQVAYVRRLRPEWTNELASELQAETELDPEEERGDSDSAPNS